MFYSTGQVARVAQCSEATVRRARDFGLLRPTVVGGRDVYTEDNIFFFAVYRATLRGARKGVDAFIADMHRIKADISPAALAAIPSRASVRPADGPLAGHAPVALPRITVRDGYSALVASSPRRGREEMCASHSGRAG